MIFFFLYLCISIVIMFVWPFFAQTIVGFTETPQEKLKEVENKTIDIMNLFNFNFVSESELRQTLMYYIKKGAIFISENIVVTIKSAAQVASYFIVTPFILFTY